MTTKQKELIEKLKEMFQFGDSDLDFGIYRIMNQKRAEVDKYLSQDLPEQIHNQLQSLIGTERQAEIAKIEKEIADTRKLSIGEETKKTVIGELEKSKKELLSVLNIDDMEGDVYSHLTNFFSRYYDDGDFISQRRYKDGVYAIPYEGEEVKLHWANADQYYVKTSEYFKDYSFKTAYGKIVNFKLVDAETEKDNNKGKNRYFQLCEEKPFAIENDTLVIRFEYKVGNQKQEKYIEEAVTAFAKVSTSYMDYADIVRINDGKTLLGINLKRYTARNTFDYFIHKDLNKFLTRELDFYIKNDVVYLDDIDTQDIQKTQEYLHKAKVIRSIGRKIISFLSQIEDFQKKLFLKKKFVYETNYCITLDRVPASLYAEIADNTAQIQEWIQLFAIDEIKANQGDLIAGATIGFSNPLTVDFLKQNQFLVLDTAFFNNDFKEKLIDSIDNLDESCDGLLIHSENFQALNLLQERYREQIDGIYIDPPYNTDASEIIYRNGYKNSSWLSLLYDRIDLSRDMLKNTGLSCVTIDDVQFHELYYLITTIYGSQNYFGTAIIKNNPQGRSSVTGFQISHEYALFSGMPATVLGRLERNEKQLARYSDKDEFGVFEWRNFRAQYSQESATMVYPIFIKKDGSDFRIPSLTWDSSNGKYLLKEEPLNDEFISMPIDENGMMRTWKWSIATVEKDKCEQMGVRRDRSGEFAVYYKGRMKELGMLPFTLWDKPEYSASTFGANILSDIIGKKKFDYPKSIFAVEDCVQVCSEKNNATILDFFAGSGTTGHAVINLNREDDGKRKYILVEMGEYFDTVTKPRIQKVIYSMDVKDDKGKDKEKGWKDGKPISRKGSSHCFKYIRLESYEDSLNNIYVETAPTLGGNMSEDFLINYCLDFETKDSASLLNISKLDKPFNYALNITRKLENQVINVDLVETFNYLLGLKVERSYKIANFDANFITEQYGAVKAELTDGSNFKFKMVEGQNLKGDKILVIWRELTGDAIKDNAALDAFLQKRRISTIDFEYDTIYVNGDNNLQNQKRDSEHWKVLLIEEEMKKLMFEE